MSHMRHEVKDNLEKCRCAAIAAVECYNRPGPRFRTAQFVIMIIVAWTGLFHAFFYNKNRRPWYRSKTGTAGRGTRYVKIDGEPKHWDLPECMKQYWGDRNPPERKNLEFILGIRNKIEHRNIPELDVGLYGECQACLSNLDQLLIQVFGSKYTLVEQLAISLQFSQFLPEQKGKAIKSAVSQGANTVRQYIEAFRSALPAATLNSMKYSFSVYLVPKVANRASSADAAVEFVKVDEASEEELTRLQRLNVLIKEKRMPIANLGFSKPGEVVAKVTERLPYRFNIWTHTRAWKYYKVRPSARDTNPQNTIPEYCVYDDVHEDYAYTDAWIDKLMRDLADPAEYQKVTGRPPRKR